MSRLVGLALALVLATSFVSSASAAGKAEVRAISSATVSGETIRGNG